eukprot:2537163-Prorocentrum_lima.AAC.1
MRSAAAVRTAMVHLWRPSTAAASPQFPSAPGMCPAIDTRRAHPIGAPPDWLQACVSCGTVTA